MNLRQTIQALEQNNIQVSVDIGVHQHCDINSNCPVAVELRKYIHEAGVTLKQLLEGFAESQEPQPNSIPFQLPEFDGKATISVAGQEVQIDFSDALRSGIGQAYERKLADFHRIELNLERLGVSLYEEYLTKIDHLKKTRILPQLELDMRDLLGYDCRITTNKDNYVFLFPRHYSPQYIVTRGIRYGIHEEDVEAIKRDVFIMFMITKDGKILSAKLLDSQGQGLVHYHGGSDDDCWGQVRIPERWDGRLRSIANFANQLISALATINKDSLVHSTPERLIPMDTLMERSTKLGEEGHMEDREQPDGGWRGDRDGTTRDAPRRRWGQREEGQRPAEPHLNDGEMVDTILGDDNA